MGTNCAPLLANLLLSYYEYKFKLKQVAKISSNTLMTYSHSITPPLNRKLATYSYPWQLELKRTTEMDSRLSYQDLEVNISDRRFTTTNKMVLASFHIVNFPHMDSN